MAPESTPGSTPQITACSFRTKEFFLGKASTGEVWFNQTSLTITQHKEKLVGLGRVELPTSPLSGVRSNQLSYRPNYSVGRRPNLVSIKSSNSCEHLCKQQSFD